MCYAACSVQGTIYGQLHIYTTDTEYAFVPSTHMYLWIWYVCYFRV